MVILLLVPAFFAMLLAKTWFLALVPLAWGLARRTGGWAPLMEAAGITAASALGRTLVSYIAIADFVSPRSRCRSARCHQL